MGSHDVTVEETVGIRKLVGEREGLRGGRIVRNSLPLSKYDSRLASFEMADSSRIFNKLEEFLFSTT